MTDLDARVFGVLFESLGGALPLMAALTLVGGGYATFGLLPFLASRRTRRAAVALLATLAATSIAVFVLKRAVARPRPCACLAGVSARVFDAPTDFSFPSGHAAGSFAFAAFLAVLLARSRWPMRHAASAALVLFASGVAVSRVALGVHFPGDVAAGAALGAALGVAGATLHLRRAHG